MAIFDPEPVKGFQDFLPPESLKRRAVKEIIEKNFKLYGFLPIETPTVEFDETMRSDTIGEQDEAVSDRFRLQDRGGRNLGLRYEFTFQLARLFKKNTNIKLPLRRYQIGNNFRDEPIGPGRFREFVQCDADIIGDSSVTADIECIAVTNSILKELKIKAEVQVNNRQLINSILDSVQITSKSEVLRELDKIDKMGEDAVKSNLKKYADSNQILTLFKLLEKDLKFFVENMFEGAETISKIKEKEKVYGYTFKFNPFLMRGLSYYTGTIFEFKIPGTKQSIAGGGRYDRLVGKYLNAPIPAVGISIGLERVTELANIKIENTKAIIISLDQDKETVSCAKKLRENDISCMTWFDKVGKALEYANSYKIPYAIFIGKEEIAKKKYKLKDLNSGEEKYLSEKQIINKLKS
jgi:histidyl-tRNA synthetase